MLTKLELNDKNREENKTRNTKFTCSDIALKKIMYVGYYKSQNL